jgi:hypothetical protein
MNNPREYDDSNRPIEDVICEALSNLGFALQIYPVHDDIRRMGALLGRPDPRKPADRLGLVPVAHSDPGWVYFARAGKSELVKIGYSTSPWTRLATLQTGSPHELHLEDAFAATPDDEQRVHRVVAQRRVRGEWFTLTPAAVATLAHAGWRGELDLFAADLERVRARARDEAVSQGMRAAW